MANNEIRLIEIEKIKTNPFQPRKEFNEQDIMELSESIKSHGLIQPIVVRSAGDGYQLIAGERRLRATQLSGKDEISAIIVDIDGVDVAEISLIENIQRKDLNCIEEANAYFILKSKFGMTQEEISERLGKSRSYIANLLRLLDLSDQIKGELVNGSITMGHGRCILSLPDEEARDVVVDRIKRDALSVRQTESLVREIQQGKEKISAPKTKRKAYSKDARIYYDALKKALKEVRSAGGRADIIERETEDFIELTVRIPKGSSDILQTENADDEESNSGVVK